MQKTLILALSLVLGVATLGTVGCKKDDAAGTNPTVATNTPTDAAPQTDTKTGETSEPMTLEAYQTVHREIHEKGKADSEKIGASLMALQGVEGKTDAEKKAALQTAGEEMETAVGGLDESVTRLRETTPPADLQEFHEASLEAMTAAVSLFKEMAGAVKSGDAAAIQATQQKMQTELTPAGQKIQDALDKAGYDNAAYDKDRTFVKKAG